MDLLLDALLKYFRVDKKELELQEVNTELLVKKVIQQFSGTKNCSFEIKSILPVIHADGISVQEVFEILIDNAVRFSDKPVAKIELSFTESNTKWIFSVKDNGSGIEKRFQEKIFVIFQTIHARDTFESTGAGLAIAKKIIENKGGYIGINSEPGQGAEFFFQFRKRVHESGGYGWPVLRFIIRFLTSYRTLF